MHYRHYSELILSPVRASCRLSFAARSCHPSSYTFVHAWCSEHLSESIPHSSQKIHMHPCMRAHATVTKLLCYGNHSELILGFCTSILQVPPAQLQSRPNPSPDAVCSKSVKIHASSWHGRRCVVVQASFDHLCWCRPHPVCLKVTLAPGHWAYPSKNSIFAIVFASCFACFCYVIHFP